VLWTVPSVVRSYSVHPREIAYPASHTVLMAPLYCATVRGAVAVTRWVKAVKTSGGGGGGIGSHVAADNIPTLQLDGPDTVNPLSQVGWHVDPDARLLLQFPLFPFVGLADASHGLGLHVAAVNLPAVQLDVPETVYQSSHVGWHVDPDARFDVQLPLSPLVGSADASHGLGLHFAAVKVPAVQLDVPETVYPLIHVGWHVDPDSRRLLQSPAFPLLGLAEASHGGSTHAVRFVEGAFPAAHVPHASGPVIFL